MTNDQILYMKNKSFVPDDFFVPNLLETDRFRLRPLSIEDVEKDYEAVMETQTRFHEMGLSWPRLGFTIQENLADLQRHQQAFDNRQAFAYTVVSLDESRTLGCVYINPVDSNEIDACVSLWVRESEYEQGLEPILFDVVKNWIHSSWPFTHVDYSGRD